MARDRNVYVWQAYVIVMSIVSFFCIGLLIYTVFLSGTNSKTVEAAVEKEKKTADDLRKANNVIQILEHIAGGRQLTEGEFDSLAQAVSGDQTGIISTYKQNKKLLGQNSGEVSYAKLIDGLSNQLRIRNSEIDDARKSERDMKANYEATIARETKAREAEKQRADGFAKDLETDRAEFVRKNTEQQKLIDSIEAQKRELIATTEKKLALKDETITKLTQENNDLKKRQQQLVKKLDEIQGEDFQYVQGRITEVVDGGQTVYINLGKAHLLRPGIMFGVIDGDTTRVSEAKPKAKIEVVEVVGDRTARCRVLSDRAPATILVHDAIYSPAWQPGREVEFALVGKMDIDGDGKDDRDVLKNLIRMAGGTVGADMTPDGKLTGELSEHTRFLVMGEDFRVRGKSFDPTSTEGARNTEAAKRRNELEQQARTLSVSKMNLDNLLAWIRRGTNSEVIPVGSGLRSKAEDYLPHKGDVPSTGRVSELFQTRDGRVRNKTP